MKRWIVLAVALVGSPVLASSGASEQQVATLEVPGTPAFTLSLVRARQSDGGLKLLLAVAAKDAKTTKKKPASVVLYAGGGEDDGPSDKQFRAATIEPFALPAGFRGARVNFEFQVPGSKKHRQTDSFLVSLDDVPKLILEATTRRDIDRGKVCHEAEETALVLDKDGRLFVRPTSTLESDLDDDDLPVDKTCHGKRPGPQITYKFDGETFLQIDPPPAPAKKKPAEGEAESDD